MNCTRFPAHNINHFRREADDVDEQSSGRGMMERDRSIPFFNGGDTKSIDLRASMTPAASMGEASQESAGRNLPFAIVSSSGQDEDHPAAELNKGIQGRGWQSSRFCFYPQELVLELQWPSRVINMQLLCHEYKIPSKVEVFVSLTTPWVQSEKAISQMKRLGYLSLDTNERSGHQARELKSIHVDSPAAVVRLVLHNCYTNKLNTYNQVGLLALIITGDPLEENQITQIKKRGFSPLLHTPRIQIPCSKMVDTAFIAVDSFTATRIHRLQQEKVLAVQEEDYDEAKRLKSLLEKLKGLGEQIKQLEIQKRAAVEVEDYDAAKICKLEIEMLRKCDGVLAESMSCPNENSDCASTITEEHQRSQESIAHSLEEKTSTRDSPSEGTARNSNSSTAGKECWTQTLEEGASQSGQLDGDFFPLLIESHPENGVQAMRDPEQNLVVAPSDAASEQSDGHFISTNHAADREEVAPVTRPRDFPRESTCDLHYTSVSHSASVLAHHNMRQSFAIPEQSGTQMQQSSSYSSSVLAKQNMRQSFAAPEQGGTLMQQSSSQPAPVLLQRNVRQSFAAPEQSATHMLQSSSQSAPNLPQRNVRQSFAAPEQSATDMPQSSSQSAPVLANRNVRQSFAAPEQSAAHVPQSSSHRAPGLAQQSVRSSFALPEQSGLHTHQSSSGDELSYPEPLTEAVKMECGPLLNLLDLHHVQCLYSKQWQLRDKAFQFIARLLQSNEFGGDSSTSFRILDSVLIRALNDRVPNVFYCGLQLLKAYVMKYSGEIPPKDLQHSSTEFVNILLDKLGDSNVRSKDAAAETLMFMASTKELGLDVIAKPLLRPTKNQAIWKPVLGRLNWLLVAIPAFGLQPQNRVGFLSEALMSYVSQAINSPNGEVRNASVKVITEVYKLMGATVERYLKGVKPMIREVLVNNFERVALETRIIDDPLTYEELDSIPIPRRSRRPAMYDIEKALDNDIQKAMSLETQKTYLSDVETAPPTKKGKQIKEGGLHTMVVEHHERIANPEDLQIMYSTEATAPIENFSLCPSEEENAEEVVLTKLRASQQDCEAHQSCRLDADTEASFDWLSNTNQDCIDNDFCEKDELSDQCLFCGKQDPNFLREDNLDLHFCQRCPMLVSCCNCKQIVEIATLKEHYLSECTSGRRYVECSKCSQAILEARMPAHVKRKECRHGKHHKTSRCPLCHHAVQPGDAGWREHLLKPPGCPKNPRTLLSS